MQQVADQEPKAEAELKVMLSAVIGRLERDAEDRVAKRDTVEKRWIEDLRQLHGEYDPETLKDLKDHEQSQLFINQTRPKTNACEARLADMLFPTDDKNWGIGPTPVPELTSEAQKAADAARLAAHRATRAQAAGESPDAVLAEGNQAAASAAKAKAQLDEAKARATAMEAEIEDQLRECSYNIQARDVIRDACQIGTGVMKGPVGAGDRSRRRWRRVDETADDGTRRVLYVLEYAEENRPAFYRVDPWSWFPDPDARTVEESESFFERHLMTKKELRKLARQPGFDQDAIRRLLREGPTKALPTYLTELRSITGENQAPTSERFQVWEYRGPLSAEEIETLCACLGREDIAEQFEEIDPLVEVQVVLWFCEGEALKFGLHHLDSGESLYSVYNLEKDESSIWGYGIPYMMRDSQKALNAAWRAMMDNAALATGPQIEIDHSVIEPADGRWILEPRKIWLRKTNAAAGKQGLNTYDIPMHQAELAGIITLAKQFIDDETSISVLAQGEQGTHTTQTAQGMSILMNAVNVVFRRMVKNFDDDVTTPNIRRLYDWNMQFSPKDNIKGDYEVDARGTSVLLVREVQSQNLLVLANMTGHPVLGLLLKAAAVLRKLSQSMMIAPDEIIKTDEEIRNEEAERQQNPPPDPEMLKLQLSKELAEIERQTKIDLAHLSRETALIQLAAKMNMDLDKLRAQIQDRAAERRSKERIIAAEIAEQRRQPASQAGGGGYV